MSTQRGNVARTRTQKHKNRTAFKNDVHDKTPQQMRLNALHISEVCQHCKSVIEWKIKYRKYKPLSKPKTCTRCQQRNIRKAYHVLCRDCARAAHVCAKCLKSADEVEIEPAKPTPVEEQKLKTEMERLIRSFPERKRRAFLRYMEKGKKQESEADEALQDEETSDNGEANPEGATNGIAKEIKKPPKRVPHSRDELLQKIEQLKMGADEEDSDSDLDFEDYEGSDNDDDDDDDDDDDHENENDSDFEKNTVKSAC